ncbi:1-(5-phosphoribosyl)-5-[(5-phosphoribosylamino)methylideneamino]imidazole-4-carboxamide isomerase [Buchnera aphidicola (Mindarus keteleerifoliae)]|uniref:1-(5-phosphoribosyl)-5-[(5- phosphoribosylamino)methylideneamino]imidazole-4- carboxamide isomerase n=1 Tax=Buchnera aphidicola TaxID=9 RepID=UPI0031B71EC0
MIIPSIDIIKGKVVRLYQGKYSQIKKYSETVEHYIEQYLISNAEMIHLVDLDGAKNYEKRQTSFFKTLLLKKPNFFQIGGGVKNEKDIEILLSFGVKRVVIGSSALKNTDKVKKWLKNYGPERIALAIDIYIHKNSFKEVVISGWKERTGKSFENIISEFSSSGLKHVLCTDVSRDGTLSGPNFFLYKEISEKYQDIEFQASGGVSSLKDISILKKNKIKSIIIGKALLENKFTLLEAKKCYQKE